MYFTPIFPSLITLYHHHLYNVPQMVVCPMCVLRALRDVVASQLSHLFLSPSLAPSIH